MSALPHDAPRAWEHDAVAAAPAAPRLLAGPALLPLALFGVFPLALVLWRSLESAGEVTLHGYAAAFAGPANLAALWDTILLCALVMVASMVVGAPLAWLVTRTDVLGCRLWPALLVAPYADVIAPLVGAIGWLLLLNPRIGYLNRPLQALFGLESGPFDVRGLGGLAWVTTLYGYPLVFARVAAALAALQPGFERAGRDPDAREVALVRMWREVARPQVWPSMLAGGFLAAGWAAASYGLAALLGSPRGVFVLSTRILSALQSGGFDAFGEAMALCGVLLALGLATAAVAGRLARHAPVATAPAGVDAPALVSLGTWRGPVVAALALAALVTVVLPLGAIVLASFLREWGFDFRPQNLTLDNYRYVLFQHHVTAPGLRHSLLLGAIAATAAALAGAALAHLRAHGGRLVRAAIDGLVALPAAAPPTVFALGLTLAFSGRYGLNLYGTFAILLAAYVMRNVALALYGASETLQRVEAALAAARGSGGGRWQTFRNVVLPAVRPGLVGALLVFYAAFREVNLSIVLYGPRTATAGVALFELQNGGFYQSAAALAVVMLAAIVAINAAIRLLTRKLVG